MSTIITPLAVLLMLAFGVYSEMCPRKITISSNRRVTTINDEEWKDKIGSYNFLKYDEQQNAIYEHETKKRSILFRTTDGVNDYWLIGDKVGVDFGWMGNKVCTETCPSNCKNGTWLYWHGVTGGKGAWKSDKTLTVDGCVGWRQTGNCLLTGPREPAHDKGCDETIRWKSGYCECSNGRIEMEKECETPEYYGYAYNTCEEACAHHGNIRNAETSGPFPMDEVMPADEPYPEESTQNIFNTKEMNTKPRDRYVTNGEYLWSCSKVTRAIYNTYDDAKKACSKKLRCSFILDEKCDDVGPFKLCKAMSLIKKSTNNCLYNKWTHYL